MAYEVFISYSHQDQPLRQKLDNHLANLKRQNIITSWYDGEITAGTNGERRSCSISITRKLSSYLLAMTSWPLISVTVSK